ncbi:MAG: hypothetical protein QOJ25_401 [Solirubrobacteraceae bacterium]|nr:hypothetical protein [Solirubrobacteraceae bacterium]
MRRCEMRFLGLDARSNRGPIRWELFIDHDLRDVLMTSRDDALCVVFLGEPRLTEWTRILTDAGFPAPEFGGPPSDAIDESLFDAAA